MSAIGGGPKIAPGGAQRLPPLASTAASPSARPLAAGASASVPIASPAPPAAADPPPTAEPPTVATPPAEPARGPPSEPPPVLEPAIFTSDSEPADAPPEGAAAAAPEDGAADGDADAIATYQHNTEVASKATQLFQEEILLGGKTGRMLHPHGRSRQRWDLVSIVLIAYNALAIPFHLAFDSDPPPLLEEAIDVFFMVDLVLNFYTGVDIDGRVEFDRQLVARTYVRTWFFIDLVSAFPWWLVLGDESDANVDRLPQMAKFLKIFRLVRLARMFRLMRIINRLEYALLIRSTISSIFKFAAVVCVASHWFSCVFFALGQSTDSHDNWIDANGLNGDDVTVYDQYVAAFYWAIMTMTTVGFGDVVAEDVYERLFSVFAMIFGALIFAYGITNVVALVANLNHDERKFREKMDRINEYMAARELPMPLRHKIREHFYASRHSVESRLSNEQEILDEISSLLRSKVALAINDHFLRNLSFFAESDAYFIMELALSMRLVYYPPFEDVIKQGDHGTEMYFIFRGAAEVVQDGKKKAVLAENDYFGEACMLHPTARRTATVRTVMFCELRSLSADKFMNALSSYPKEQARVSDLLHVPVEAIEEAKRRRSSAASPPSTGRAMAAAPAPVAAAAAAPAPAKRPPPVATPPAAVVVDDPGSPKNVPALQPARRLQRGSSSDLTAPVAMAASDAEAAGDAAALAGAELSDVMDLLHSVLDQQQAHSDRLETMTQQLSVLEGVVG